MINKKNQVSTFEDALQYAEKYCSLQERCPKDVRCKLRDKGISEEDAKKIVSKLIKTNFISEERYTELYVRRKIHQSHWGRIKIKNMLSAKQISKNTINKALAKIDEKEYREILNMLLQRKLNNIKTEDEYQKKYQLRYYLSSHGFENELIEECFEENNI